MKYTSKVLSKLFLTGSHPIMKDDTLKHFAFIGRSNVGKSSMINSLVGQTIAHHSKTPGRTITVNYYKMSFKSDEDTKECYIVDLPGYGFAHRNKKELDRIRKMILHYLFFEEIPNLTIFHLIDAKVGFTPFDIEIQTLIRDYDVDSVLIYNKIDKVTQSEYAKLTKDNHESLVSETVFTYSSVSKINQEKILDFIFDV